MEDTVHDPLDGRLVAHVQLRDGAQVGAGAEASPRAGEHDDPDALVLFDEAEGRAEVAHQRLVHGVQ